MACVVESRIENRESALQGWVPYHIRDRSATIRPDEGAREALRVPGGGGGPARDRGRGRDRRGRARGRARVRGDSQIRADRRQRGVRPVEDVAAARRRRLAD